jgi:hypothetical protein
VGGDLRLSRDQQPRCKRVVFFGSAKPAGRAPRADARGGGRARRRTRAAADARGGGRARRRTRAAADAAAADAQRPLSLGQQQAQRAECGRGIVGVAA